MVMGMGCSNMPDINKPLPCPVCGEAPSHVEWEGQYKPVIHQLACYTCRKAVRGYSKGKAVERWNKFVLSHLICSEREGDGNA